MTDGLTGWLIVGDSDVFANNFHHFSPKIYNFDHPRTANYFLKYYSRSFQIFKLFAKQIAPVTLISQDLFFLACNFLFVCC